MSYTITIYRSGKAQVSTFKSLEAAKDIAAQIFKARGVVVSIEQSNN